MSSTRITRTLAGALLSGGIAVAGVGLGAGLHLPDRRVQRHGV
ncbi:hypothetical protein [Mycobacterium sp. 1423905.2]|nr:hypothetical protein [Mycobacterium sp. 1423905.2]